MTSSIPHAAFVLLCASTVLIAQNPQSPQSPQNPQVDPNAPTTTLRVNSRAVLVDVLVTDKNGNPVTGLKQDAFTVSEQGKPQTISFFEEHNSAAEQARASELQMPAFPPNVFSNFSPIPAPPAVNVLLLDSLNTPMEDQVYVHAQAMKFLKSLKPGSRMAIFTMSLGLRFVQGFTDDPALLVAALGSKKRNELDVPELIKSPEDANAQTTVTGLMNQVMPAGPGGTTTAATQAMIDALTGFFSRTETAQTDDRAYRTLQNMQELATFLRGFPGRKNLIWFSEQFPLNFVGIDSAQFNGTDTRTETRFEDDLKKTLNLLTAARVAVYPVDARGVKGNTFYEAGNTLSQTITDPSGVVGVNGAQVTQPMAENTQRDSDQEVMQTLARDSGGKAFVNGNDFAGIIATVVSSSSDFYTVSYMPQNEALDGKYRKVDVKIAGGKYNLSFRRGYFADSMDLPGAQPVQSAAAAATDPLRPFMVLGMPQTEQILYKTLIQPLPPKTEPSANDNPSHTGQRYSVDFALDTKDLNLKLENDGTHKGTLVVSLIVFDRYGQISSRRDHLVALNIKPETYAVFQQAGVQLHAEIEAPSSQYWLRTGIYDQASHKVGTMEVPLAAVRQMQASTR